jgi:nicotinate-nucleotide adenylyltransferase
MGQKICIFGGTFDPIHNGHIIIAQTILEKENLDQMMFVPCGDPPHKTNQMFDSRFRYKMVDAALNHGINRNNKMYVSNIEVVREGKSYTVDTIREMKKNFKNYPNELSFLIGMDNLYDIQNWEGYETILSECQVIVADRTCIVNNDVPSDILKRVKFVHVPTIDISSTDIRKRIIEGRSIMGMVPESVEQIIYKRVT